MPFGEIEIRFHLIQHYSSSAMNKEMFEANIKSGIYGLRKILFILKSFLTMNDAQKEFDQT